MLMSRSFRIPWLKFLGSGTVCSHRSHVQKTQCRHKNLITRNPRMQGTEA